MMHSRRRTVSVPQRLISTLTLIGLGLSMAVSVGQPQVVRAATFVANTNGSRPSLNTSLSMVAIPSAASFAGVTISNVKINGGGNTTTASPGSTVTVSMDYTIVDPGWPGCIEQIQIGYSTADPATCIYSGIPGAGGDSGSATTTLNVPSSLGAHYCRRHAHRVVERRGAEESPLHGGGSAYSRRCSYCPQALLSDYRWCC